MTKQEIIDYMYENHVQGDFKIEEMAEDLSVHKGKWIFIHPLQEDDQGAYMCSNCKSGSFDVNPKTWKACPWCMADMREGD